MRKTILLIPAFLFAVVSVSAQSKVPSKNNHLYIRLTGGYTASANGSYDYLGGVPINGTGESSVATPTSYTFNLKKASYSAGSNLNLAVGVMFNEHVGAELSAGFIFSRKYKYKEVTGNLLLTRTYYLQSPILVTPSLVLTTGEKLKLFSRIGIAVPLAGKIIVEDYAFASPYSGTKVIEIKNRFSLGIAAALGAKFYLFDGLSMCFEANGLFMNMNARSAEITKYELNGTNSLHTLTEAERKAEFSGEFNYDSKSSSGGITAAGPLSVSFSNIGGAVGICVEL